MPGIGARLHTGTLHNRYETKRGLTDGMVKNHATCQAIWSFLAEADAVALYEA